MFIRAVNEAMEKLIRARLPLPEEIGDVAYDSPTSNWSAQLSRITVNCFLYGVGLSAQPVRAPITRVQDERTERRRPQPMIDLDYLVTAWAGTPRDEHQLLGDLVSIMVATQAIPEEFFSTPISSTASLSFGADTSNRAREIWSSLGGHLKAGFQLRVSVAADSYDWELAPAPVERIEAMTEPNVRR